MEYSFSQIQIEDIIYLYTNNVSVDEILAKYNCEEYEIRRILKDYQIDRKYNSFSEELMNRILNTYSLGVYSYQQCQKQLLISDTGLKRILSRNGIENPLRDNSVFHKYKRNSNYFDVITSQDQAYILGMILTDGTHELKKHRITIGLQEDDKDVLIQIANAIGYDGPLIYTKSNNPNHKNAFSLRISDKHISDCLLKLGVIPNKTKYVEFPQYLSDDLIPHFIRGAIDGDGSITYNSTNKCWRVGFTGTYSMCNGIKQFFSEKDIRLNFYPDKRSDGIYNLWTGSTKNTYELLSIIYKNAKIKMERKYLKYLQVCEDYYMKSHNA